MKQVAIHIEDSNSCEKVVLNEKAKTLLFIDEGENIDDELENLKKEQVKVDRSSLEDEDEHLRSLIEMAENEFYGLHLPY
ncbi:MAG TPA: hypothetical protein PLM93_09305 [Sulfuricurvum sp.]|nr:MAG: hypothetical protein B7Y30_07380 [Campylobacterales bacterium 16-40-21]OZA02464.1 MAG: hypothetical protein B7X89_08975 [Sulfuricurvum sp. 17-40-25]HQS67364.1 hypothetical protein [Sulfuricurvum sp.]HQT36115.1 hypothetical protein [Sulfuricurvum sp.]